MINNAGSLELKVVGDSQKSQRIEFKSDYSPWALLTSDTGKSEWNFPISSSDQRRLFRVVESVRPRNFNHSSWKGNLDFPEEPFLSENLGESFEVVKWVKFTILMDDSNKVYFQDSRNTQPHARLPKQLQVHLQPTMPRSEDHISSIAPKTILCPA